MSGGRERAGKRGGRLGGVPPKGVTRGQCSVPEKSLAASALRQRPVVADEDAEALGSYRLRKFGGEE